MNITIDKAVKNIISSLKKKFRSEDIKTLTKGTLASTSRSKIIVVYTENDRKTVKNQIVNFFTDNAVMFTNLDKKTPLSGEGHLEIQYPGTVPITIKIVVFLENYAYI